jgi:uncharacterized protein GlcG (DUF336 family)
MIAVAEAMAAIDAIVAATAKDGFLTAVAVCDEHANLVAAYRMDGSPDRWMKVAIRKAHTAAAMGRSTAKFHAEMTERHMQVAYYGDPMFTGLPGGIPIVGRDGETLGGIGVTGNQNRQDEKYAAFGLRCFSEAAASDPS